MTNRFQFPPPPGQVFHLDPGVDFSLNCAFCSVDWMVSLLRMDGAFTVQFTFLERRGRWLILTLLCTWNVFFFRGRVYAGNFFSLKFLYRYACWKCFFAETPPPLKWFTPKFICIFRTQCFTWNFIVYVGRNFKNIF